jgi:hypothetical protein
MKCFNCGYAVSGDGTCAVCGVEFNECKIGRPKI